MILSPTPPGDLDPGELGNGSFATYWISREGCQEEVSTGHSFCGSNIFDLGSLGLLYF